MTWFEFSGIPWRCNHCRKSQFYERRGDMTRWVCKSQYSPIDGHCGVCGTTWDKETFGYEYFEFDFVDIQDRVGECLLNHPKNHLKEIWNGT